jgi:hypothetical protein
VRNVPGALTVDQYGVLQQPSMSSIDALVVHYSYDGLGRVIRTQRPASDSTTPANSGALIITDLYYDGVRVVQEVGWGGSATTGGGSGVPVRARRDASGAAMDTAPGLPRRANEMTVSGATGGQCELTSPPIAGGFEWQDRRLEREYVWAGDSAAYVDENVAQLVYTSAHTPASVSTSGQPV